MTEAEKRLKADTLKIRAKEYRALAAECRMRSQRTRQSSDRVMHEQMAKTWEQLALSILEPE